MLAFLDDLAQNLGDVPLLLLATGRQEVLELVGPGADFVSCAKHVALGPLSGEETGRLSPFTPGRKVPARQPSGGVARAQRRQPAVRRGARAPARRPRPARESRRHSRPQARRRAAHARLDRRAHRRPRLDLLAPERRALLADASVVGPSFWPGAVAAVGGREPAEVLFRSSRARRQGAGPPCARLVRSRARPSSSSFTPWSATWPTPS